MSIDVSIPIHPEDTKYHIAFDESEIIWLALLDVATTDHNAELIDQVFHHNGEWADADLD